MATKPQPTPIGSMCRSFAELGELEAIEVEGAGAAILRDSGGVLDAAAKAKLIEAVRGGSHVELSIRAITFRQRDGSPNKNHLRFKRSKLGDIATSFVGKPSLVDHDKHSQSSRIGTITASEAVPLPGGWTGFRQTIRVVKPHAVISVLDGTIDRFSIGWDPRGTVICTVHKVDVRSRASCYWKEDCYPGKSVEVDGKAEIAEYEWQSTEGLETSGVNTPAVTGTKIEDIRTALAAELSLSIEPEHSDDYRKDPRMNLAAMLATVLGANATLSEADLVRGVEDLKSGKLAAEQERDSAIKRAELAESKIAEAQAAELSTKVDAILADAYKAGKLLKSRDKVTGAALASPRETFLRRIAKSDGLAALEAELAEYPIVVPVGRVVLDEVDPSPKASSGPLSASVLASTAKQLGLSVDELTTHANTLSGLDGRGDN